MKRVGWLFLFLAIAASGWAKTKVTNQTIEFEGRVRTYSLYVPEFAEPMPVVVILHSYTWSSDDGNSDQWYDAPRRFEPITGDAMADSWEDLASKEHFIVVAPNDQTLNPSDVWNGELNPPAFFRAVIEQVSAQHPIDRSRIYSFGVDEGAQYALSIAIVDSNFYAAVAVYSCVLDHNYSMEIARAHRRIPIALWSGINYMGDPLKNARQTKAILESNGFPVELNILPEYWCVYFRHDGSINEKAWNFLKKTQLKLPRGE